MADEPHLWQPGDIISGKYELLKVLGEGGMGVVYEATHLRLRQRVAIKMVRPSLAARYSVVVRFEREARAAAQLRTPHAPKIIDVDATAEGLPYIVMEFLEGRDLAQVLVTRGVLPIDEVVGWLLETCCAIAEAHDLGIVHRDLKPSNLLLATDGNRAIIKVLDFGISKVADESDASLTATHVTLGTPSYMSPEQVRSAKHVDARTDIWSLGVILYELLSGALPFSGTTASSIAAAIVADPVFPLRKHRPGVSPDLEAVVNKALAKQADDRFPDVRSFAAALAPFASTKLDPHVAAELGQLLAAPRSASLRADEGTADVASPSDETRPGPTAPGWSQLTAAAATPQRRALVFSAVILVVIAGYFARDVLRPVPSPISSGSGLTPPRATSSSDLSIGGLERSVAGGAPIDAAAAPSETSAVVEVTSAAPAPPPKPGGKRTPARPMRPASPPAGVPPASPPPPTNNPLHL